MSPVATVSESVQQPTHFLFSPQEVRTLKSPDLWCWGWGLNFLLSLPKGLGGLAPAAVLTPGEEAELQ